MDEQFPLDQQWLQLQKVKDDFNSFEPLYLHYYPRIYRFVFVRISDKHLAEDLTSHIFLKLAEHLPKKTWHSIEAFIKYLYLIARSTLKNHYRDYKHVMPLDYEKGAEDSGKDLVDLNDAYRTLKKEEQELLYLYYFMGYSFEEICTIQGKKGSSVRMKHKRLLEKLKSLL